MKWSPVFPRDETANCDGLGYDPHDDFFKFLEEARSHANEPRFEPTTIPAKENEKAADADGRKSRWSWKSAMLFFRRRPEKGTLTARAAIRGDGPAAPPPRAPRRSSAVSGPIKASKHHLCRNARAVVSGPLSGCFTPARAEEEEEAEKTPYVWLERCGTPSRAPAAFGPIYLVT